MFFIFITTPLLFPKGQFTGQVVLVGGRHKVLIQLYLVLKFWRQNQDEGLHIFFLHS